MGFVDRKCDSFLLSLIQKQKIKYVHKFCPFLSSWSLEGDAGREREGEQQASQRPAQLCYSSSSGKTVYCRGQGPRHMFTSALRWAIVVKAHPVHAKAALKIVSYRSPLPRGQMKPILTRFIRSTHKRTFKTHFEFWDKTSATLVFLFPVAISLLNPYLFFHINVNLILFVLWFALRHAELNITSFFPWLLFIIL